MIKLTAIGNLGRDAVMNTVSGKNVINFTVAHTERFKDAQGNQKDKTIWVDCAYWTERTGIAPYLKKGTQVYVEGQPDVRTYTTKEGVNGATLSLRVSSVQLLGSRSNDGGAGTGNYQASTPTMSSQSSSPAASEIMEPMDDLPF
jgi:single-strand DNA-binding protein